MRKLNLFLFLVSVLCFGFGNSFTAWFVFVPVFFLVNRLDFPGLPAWGFAYGFCSYFLFLLWMLNFSIVALFGACLLYGLYWLLIFALLKIILAKAKSFAEGRGWGEDYLLLFDKNQDFMRAMNVSLVPHVFVVDGKGNIVYSHTSYVPGNETDLFNAVKKCR